MNPITIPNYNMGNTINNINLLNTLNSPDGVSIYDKHPVISIVVLVIMVCLVGALIYKAFKDKDAI